MRVLGNREVACSLRANGHCERFRSGSSTLPRTRLGYAITGARYTYDLESTSAYALVRMKIASKACVSGSKDRGVLKHDIMLG